MKTGGLARVEWLALTAALAAASAWHWSEIAWPRFLAAFLAIDLLGYWPGAIAFRRARGGPVHPVYARLYNATHNFLTGAAATAVWAVLAGGGEWAMLAIPLHLAGDRGLFANGFKRVDEPFERLVPQASGAR